MTTRYNVHYNTPNGVQQYCMAPTGYKDAERTLERFKSNYMNQDGTGKTYPNGKGFYPFTNPRIAEHVEIPGEREIVAELTKRFG